jgi:hypothetical protein
MQLCKGTAPYAAPCSGTSPVPRPAGRRVYVREMSAYPRAARRVFGSFTPQSFSVALGVALGVIRL